MLARQCDAGKEIINMLKYGVEGRPTSDKDQSAEGDTVQVRQYNKWSSTCGVCLGPIFGLVYTCTSCPDYNVCKKCFATIATFHSAKTKGDGQPHILEANRDRKEYKDPPQPHAGGEETTSGLREGQESGGDTGTRVAYYWGDIDTGLDIEEYI
ncbi:MAG: hypothetical protein M1840_004986 [Geoglossum simile]|nr:MAG: hypothetical protein M1840_004986 [Geoglossum simile]